MKQIFNSGLELSEFLSSNKDKVFKIKTRFSYKNDGINVKKYEVIEMEKPAENEEVTFTDFRDMVKFLDANEDKKYKVVTTTTTTNNFSNGFLTNSQDVQTLFTVTRVKSVEKVVEKEKKTFIVGLFFDGNVKVLKPGLDVYNLRTYVSVSASSEEEAILLATKKLPTQAQKPSLLQESKYNRVEDIEKEFQSLKAKALDSSIGVGNPYWTRMFHGPDVLELVKSFYQHNWGYKAKLDAVKSLDNICVSGMFLTDSWLTVTIRADIKK